MITINPPNPISIYYTSYTNRQHSKKIQKIVQNFQPESMQEHQPTSHPNNKSINPKSTYCQHNKPASHLCINLACLHQNEYVLCQQQCIGQHTTHPQDIIPYSIFLDSLPQYQRSVCLVQNDISQMVRQSMNRLLHLRLTIAQAIDTEMQYLRTLLFRENSLSTINNGNLNENTNLYLDGNLDFDINTHLKECLLKIQTYQRKEGVIVFNFSEDQKQVNDNVKRMWSRLGRSVREILKTANGIFDTEQAQNNEKTLQKKKSYQYKIQGKIGCIVKLLKSTPKHVDRLKIYLNQEQLINQQQYVHLQITTDMASKQIQKQYHSLRNYKETYQQLLNALYPLTWIQKVNLSVWDGFLEREGKLDMLAEGKRKSCFGGFFVEDKLKGITHTL